MFVQLADENCSQIISEALEQMEVIKIKLKSAYASEKKNHLQCYNNK